MENSTTTISREELEELQEAFNKIGTLERNYTGAALLWVSDFQEQSNAFIASTTTHVP